MIRMSTAAPAEAPSLRQLNRATLFAAGISAVILVVAVLPAEYGRDPTGIGSLLGLTAMGESKEDPAVAEADRPVTYVQADEGALAPGTEQTKRSYGSFGRSEAIPIAHSLSISQLSASMATS